jgi:tetratricopeptide (TPR) repeat protein
LALKVAAVIGRTFGYEPLLYLMRSSSDRVAQALREHLDALARNDLTDVETPDPDLSYIFNHIITQEVAYQTLLFAHRQQLHRLAAEWYQATFDGHTRLAPFYPLLVYHYRLAEDPVNECRYARLAGEHAARQFANGEALMYLSRALELTPTDALRERFDLLLARERVFDVQADRVSQQQDLAELEALAALLNDAIAQAEVALRKARCLEYLGDFARAFASVDDGLRVAPLGSLEAVALKIMGAGLHHRQGRHREGLDWCQSALDTPELPAVHHLRAHAESLTGVIYTYLGRPGEALAPLELALEQYVHLEDLPGQFDVYANLDLALSLRAAPGDWKRAFGYLRQAQSLAERMGDAERKARISNNLGWSAYCLGDADQAIDYYLYSLQVWTTSGGRVMSAIVRTNLGAAELANGDTGRAFAYLYEAVAALEEAGALGQLAETRRYLALTHLAVGDVASAHAAAALALALAREVEAPMDEAGAQRVLGQIALAAGELEGAVGALEASRILLSDQGNRYELAQTLTGLAEAFLAQDRREEARDLLVEAVEVFTELDASRDLARAAGVLRAVDALH